MKVLMVTGAYDPEISSGGRQSALMARMLRDRVDIRVLTTALDRTTPRRARVDDVEVTRIHLRMGRPLWQVRASFMMAAELLRLVRWCDIIHVHGVSTKNVLVTVIAKLVGRPVVLSLHTMGADTPEAIIRTGPLAWWSFRSASRYLAVSPALMHASLTAGVPPGRIVLVPNGIATDRFAPASPAERRELRRSVGHDVEGPVLVFVGYFSHDKQPRVLFDAWLRLCDEHGLDTTLWLVGATKSDYFEVDQSIADGMRADAAARGRLHRLIFAGAVRDVHHHFRLADVFVLPSRREGLPVALMEAMSCGLPCVASHLPGATDALIVDGQSGRLVPVGDVGAFARAIAEVLNDPAGAAAMGMAARQTIVDRFASETIAQHWLACYDEVLGAGTTDLERRRMNGRRRSN